MCRKQEITVLLEDVDTIIKAEPKSIECCRNTGKGKLLTKRSKRDTQVRKDKICKYHHYCHFTSEEWNIEV